MKKYLIRAASAALTSVLMFSSAAVCGATTAETQMQTEMVICEKSTEIELPSFVDLSETRYFPKVGNQGGLGSCATYASIYYQFTYEMNRSRDVAATEETTASPKLIYHLCNAAFGGTLQEQNYDLLIQQGAPTIATLPYTDEEHLNWFAEEKYWREAMDYRVESYYTLEDVGLEDSQITSVDDEDLFELKKTLSEGKMLTYSTCIYSWVTDKLATHPDAPENAKYEGEEIVKYRNGNSGGHGMTLVGYNDNIWVDQNGNNQVDKGEMGAFKIVNSWGEGYANDGFCWIAYDALNKVTSVDGGYSGYREPVFQKCMAINVRPYKDGSDIYVKFTMNTADRSQMEVSFSAEKDGTVESAKFLTNTNYRTDRNRYSFAGTTEATDGTFCYPLDNVSPELSAENFKEYSFSVSFSDAEKDGTPLIVKSVEIINESAGEVYRFDGEEFAIDGEEKTLLIKESESANKTVYYIGYDEPYVYYKGNDGMFRFEKMEYTEERSGYNYKYVFENYTDDMTLYFSDKEGNTDDNGGAYYTASERLNYYSTQGVREPLQITDTGYRNGLPDVDKTSYLQPVVVGGYAPYKFRYVIEDMQTGEIKEYPYDIRYEPYYTFPAEGEYRFFIEVTDQANNTAILDQIVEIEDIPFEFVIFSATSSYGKSMFVGESINFYAQTDFENIISRGPFHSKYEFVVKDEDGKSVYVVTKKSDECNLSECISKISLEWTPEKSGKYTITISSTDDNDEYAERTLEFTVLDKIYGDADGNGRINIKDATITQKHLAALSFGKDEFFYEEMAHCTFTQNLDVRSVTAIQKYVAQIDADSKVGEVIAYEPPYTEPEETLPEETLPEETEPSQPKEERNIVYFTNSLGWSGSVYCYYWSDSNKNMTSWPGQMMAEAGTNEFGQKIYTMELKTGTEYVIFSGGGAQTVDIPYGGGEMKYYAVSETDSSGHYKVENW